MRIKFYALALIASSTSAFLWMSPALARFSEDTVFYRFAYRASRVLTDFDTKNPNGRMSDEKHSYGRLLSLSLLDYCAG
jgi:hypothetical protein